MLTQLSVLGRTSRRGATCKSVRRSLHSDVAVGAKSEKTGNAQASAEGAIKSTFAELLEEQIASYPHKDTYASAGEDLKWTTQQMQWHITGVTGSLHGVPSKGRTSYTSQAALRGEFLIGLLAAPEAGKLFAVIPPFRPDQLIDQLQQAQAQFLLFFPKIGKTAQIDDIYKVFPELKHRNPQADLPFGDARVPHMHSVVHTAKRIFAGMVHHIDFQVPHYPKELLRRGLGPISSEDVSTLIWENGAFEALSQYNLLNTAHGAGAALGLNGSSTIVSAVSASTAAGITTGLLLPLVHRSKIVVASDAPSSDVAKIHESIAQHGANSVLADAATWSAILSQSQPAQVKAFADKIGKAVIVSDATPVDPQLAKAISSTLGVKSVHTTNGTAQSAGVALVDGKPIAGSQAKVVDGFLAVKGVNASLGAFKAGKLTSSAAKDGFVQTKIKAQQASGNTFSVSH